MPSLANGTEYTFRVRAVNGVGDGDASDAATATPEGTVPTLPEGHTELLKGTLTVAELSNGFGCANTQSGKECSTSTTLTDDDFDYDGSRNVLVLRVQASGDVYLQVDPFFAAALQAEVKSTFTLHLGGEALSFSSSDFLDPTQHVVWAATDVRWVAGSVENVLLETSATPPDAPTNL